MYGLGDALPPGTRTEVSSALAALLGTPRGRAFYNATQDAVRSAWDIRAVGSQTPTEVANRIAGVFTEFYATRWSGPVTSFHISQSPELVQTVNSVCPLCRKKDVPTPLPGPGAKLDHGIPSDWAAWYAGNKQSAWTGAAVLGGLLLLAFVLRPKRGAAAAPAVLALPATVMPALPAPK